jgi:carboxypeptidase family protein
VERVKGALITVCWFLAAIPARAASVEVRQMTLQQSARHVRISVLLNGRPTPGVSVDFCTSGDKPCRTSLTDENGIANSPKLPDGDYIVTASLEDVSGGDLYLHVSRKGKTRSFPIDLTESFRAAQEFRSAADKLPIREIMQAFQGVLRDPSGATISGVDIKIVRRGSEDHAIVQRLKSDSNGHFSVPLGEGTYVALFSCPGFRTEIVPFEIAAHGSEELVVSLQLAQMTESTRVANKR